ncbi:uncharacterized protein LOC134529384 isoform X5 [Bacillus rossius redtenbacheri]|uniref:uncharacterized protein LOC134529384 isoform X5 n=1 Tax=Bacillus rossius redtenbacheri TaxID=93214 RepID=UPI002FDD1D6D
MRDLVSRLPSSPQLPVPALLRQPPPDGGPVQRQEGGAERNSDAGRRRPTAAAREKWTTWYVNTDADRRIKTTAVVEKGLLLLTGDWTAEIVTSDPRSAVILGRRIPSSRTCREHYPSQRGKLMTGMRYVVGRLPASPQLPAPALLRQPPPDGGPVQRQDGGAQPETPGETSTATICTLPTVPGTTAKLSPSMEELMILLNPVPGAPRTSSAHLPPASELGKLMMRLLDRVTGLLGRRQILEGCHQSKIISRLLGRLQLLGRCHQSKIISRLLGRHSTEADDVTPGPRRSSPLKPPVAGASASPPAPARRGPSPAPGWRSSVVAVLVGEVNRTDASSPRRQQEAVGVVVGAHFEPLTQRPSGII